MKLSVFAVLLQDRSFEDACKYLSSLGVQAVEIGCGGFPGKAHCDAKDFLAHPEKIDEMLATLKKYNLEIAALSTHGNPVHPNKEIARQFHEDFENAVMLAEKMHVDTVVTFSGCPGGCKDDKTPNWVTCPWPDDFLHILDYQWNDVLIPYWKKEAEYAAKYGVNKIAFEMHPGFCVYNPETLMKLRGAVGSCIGANFDPSHLIWQGIDPVEAIRYIGENGAMFHFHAKDTRIDHRNTEINGVLDTKHYGDEIHRSWVFRALGYGSDEKKWKDMVSMLQLVGYNHVMSIEHEDSFMTSTEGLEKAIAFLRGIIISEPKPGGMFWA